ncbi:MAG: hypothetical protein PHE20_01835 [Patescibacteria group bacterium]|nr:hypothetical protein [Patescibacteria group bacterium]
MPKLKKETGAKTSVKKTKKKTVKKTPAKSVVKKIDKTEDKPLPKARPITIDVIADDEDILSRQSFSSLPEDNAEEREGMDVQKKFFSDLVAEIKDNKNKKMEDNNLPFPAGKIPTKVKTAKSLGLYRRIATQFILLTAILLLVVAYFFLPSLKISLHPAAEAVVDTLSFQVVSSNSVEAETNASRSITGQLRSLPLSAEKVYEASGEEILGEEIAGEVTLYNEYNKDQPLVIKTRLLSPDNKLFRIKEAVTVPAGGSVKVAIYADEVSAEMAIAPTRFTIPGLWVGLQDKIYATSDKAFEYKHQIKYYVKQRDLDQAINDIKATLDTKAQATIDSLGGSAQALAYKLDKDITTIELGAKLGEETPEFTVSASNNLTLSFFSKTEAEALVKAKLAFLLPDDKKLSDFNSDDIAYRLDLFDADADVATVTASFRGSMSLRTDADIIDRRQLVNLNKAQISEYLKAYPEIDSFNLEFFPSFMNRAPSLSDRIKVEVVQ